MCYEKGPTGAQIFTIIMSISAGLLSGLILLGRAMDQPIVEKDLQTSQCVRVRAPVIQGRFSCTHLPENYETVWVIEEKAPQADQAGPYGFTGPKSR